jgi:hypothetical protein
MSRDPVGGYTVFPATLTRADLIAVTLEALERAPEEVQAQVFHDDEYSLPDYGYPLRTVDLAVLAEKKSGVLEVDRGTTTIWFEPAAGSYPLATFWVYWRIMVYENYPEKVDSFARRWLQLCEQGKALFGYFSPYGHMFERDCLLEEVLPAFEDGSVTGLLNAITPSWLIYFGHDLAERWRQAERPTPSPTLISQDLPSGAHFIRAGLDVFESQNSVKRPW